MDIEEMVARLAMEVQRLSRIQSRMLRFGAVSQVDPAKARARVMLSDPDNGSSFEGPWRPWAEVAGATKTWQPVTVGQQMLVVSPGGDLRQSLLLPATFSNDHPAPSVNGEANRMTFGSVTIDVESDRYGISAPKIDLGAGGKAVARVGDMVHVTFGSSAGMHPIVQGSGSVFAAD